MGCLKSIVKKIIVLALIVAFFALGGWAFVKKKINDYQNPTREEFIESEKSFGDFSSVASDYQLGRNFNLFGYKKINAKYLPTGQKITIYDLKNKENITPDDFKTKAIDEKIDGLLDKFKDSFITFEDFQIVERSSYNAKNKQIPYIRFNSKVKNIPFKQVSGIVAIYDITDDNGEKSVKLVTSMTDLKAYNPTIVRSFIQAVKF